MPECAPDWSGSGARPPGGVLGGRCRHAGASPVSIKAMSPDSARGDEPELYLAFNHERRVATRLRAERWAPFKSSFTIDATARGTWQPQRAAADDRLG